MYILETRLIQKDDYLFGYKIAENGKIGIL